MLDFGCGTGSSSSIFNPDNYLVIDCDSRRVYYARNLYSDYYFTVVHDHNIPIPKSSIDFILVISVLHHILTKELPLYLKEFHRALKLNGKILAIEPCFFENCGRSNLYMKLFYRGKIYTM